MGEHAFKPTGFLWLGSAVRYTIILTDLNIANSTPSETPYNFVGFCHKMTCVLCVFVLVVNKEKSSNFALTTEVT